MPSESLTLAATSGFGVGIIAGIVSGVCYVLVHGIVRKRPRNSKGQWHCTECGTQFRSIEGVLETGRVVSCEKCASRVCRARCSVQNAAGWICKSCQNPEPWFKGILRILHPKPTAVCAKMDQGPFDETEEDADVLKKKEKEQVRDFIERLVEAMLGSNIDNASIARIYNDQRYLPVIGQSPCSAHASLKLLIQKIIQEAIGLPNLKRAKEHSGSPEEVNRTYEDLLATAILNKVIQNYQDELPSSSGNSVSSRVSNSPKPNDKEYFFGEETLQTKWKNGNSSADVDTTSVSSLEEWVRSDSSVGSTKYVDHMSLTIQQRIEEVSSSDDEDSTVPVSKPLLEPGNENWQENWTLQRRKLGRTASPVPVPMLVPQPTIDAKVLIGDRDAEDTTDLSDAGSDYEEIRTVQPIESILVESKTVIGGKNLVPEQNGEIKENGCEKTEAKVPSPEPFMSLQDDSLEISETINTAVVEHTELEDTSPVSLESHTEQDSEYTEKYATLPRTILKSPSPMHRDLKSVTTPPEKPKTPEPELVAKKVEENGDHGESDEDVQLREKFKGSYSEREKLKWNNAVEMKNNPYSPENLTRRLSGRSTDSAASLFGRDYYIREAAKSSGARKKEAEEEVDYAKIQHPANSSKPSSPVSDSESLFKAVPALVDTDSPQQTDNESSLGATSSPIGSSLVEPSSDSDANVERIYNLHTGKIYEKVGDTHREIVAGSRSPMGIKYTSNPDLHFSFDENHNSTINGRKREFLRSLTEDHLSEVPSYQPDSLEAKENFSLEYSTEGYESLSNEQSLSSNPDPEIVDLKDKHLVKDRLGIFSKSYPNLAAVPLRKGSEKERKLQDRQQSLSGLDQSVEDLKRKFDNEEAPAITEQEVKNKPRSTLTLSSAIKHKTENGLDISDHELSKNDSGSGEPEAFPSAKSRIKFFENLKQ